MVPTDVFHHCRGLCAAGTSMLQMVFFILLAPLLPADTKFVSVCRAVLPAVPAAFLCIACTLLVYIYTASLALTGTRAS